MNKKKKIKIFLICIILLLIVLLGINNKIIQNKILDLRIKKYGEPILEGGLINNEFFGIYDDLQNAIQTTKGLNEAIKYANKNNISYLKLKKGKYLVTGITENNQQSGIILESNIELDLNGSTIKQKNNSSQAYICISIHDVQNVKIFNGIIVGDMEEHTFEPNTTSEWGHGISIISSKYINISNIEIYNTIGDCIYISKHYENESTNKYVSNDIVVENCNLHNSRRQGISVIAGKNISIINNEIHNIKGTAPQSGIDLESNNYSDKIEDIYILNNKFYDLGSSRAIKLQRYITNVEIAGNEIKGTIYGFDGKGLIYINDNNIKEGNIIFRYADNERLKVEKVYIENNSIVNGSIILEEIKNIIINKNKIEKGNIEIISSNAEIINNNLNNDYAIELLVRDDIENRIFNIHIKDNMNDFNDEVNIINEGNYYIFY